MMPSPEETSGTRSRFADETYPSEAVVDGASLARDLDEAFDFVVVGTGAAGAVAAHVLTLAGFEVAMVEEGGWLKTREVGEDVHGIFRRAMRDGGTQAIEGKAFIPMLQGRAVGGSTLVNSAIAWRTPEDVLVEWQRDHGLGADFGMKSIEPHFEALERDLGVREVEDEVLGGNSRSFVERARARGMEHNLMKRYERGCRGSARCLTGCPHGAKQGMNVTYVPWALCKGARLFTSCRVERVIVERGRAVGVRATTTSRGGHRVTLRARQGVIVAASTIQTPNILRRSGLRSRHLGEHFQAHPGIACGGVLPGGVRMDFGATQGAESVAYRSSDRFKFETIAMPPDLLTARMPGIGSALVDRMARYPDVAVWGLQLRAEAKGTVSRGWGGRDVARLTLSEGDLSRARRALAILARMMFEHGATEVWPGVHGVPPVITSPDQVRLIDEAPLDPRAYAFIATHLFGAARMSPDPRAGVVDERFEAHEVRGLHVVDSSVFPTNLGVNPQHTIMALARLAATKLAESTSRARAAV